MYHFFVEKNKFFKKNRSVMVAVSRGSSFMIPIYIANYMFFESIYRDKPDGSIFKPIRPWTSRFQAISWKKVKNSLSHRFLPFFLENGPVFVEAALKKTHRLPNEFNEPVLSRFYEKIIKIFIKINPSGPLKSLNISSSPNFFTEVYGKNEAQVCVLWW